MSMVDIDSEFRGGVGLFKRVEPKRPTVIRKGDTVKTCYFYKGMGTCLGPQCFWPRVGTCPFYNRLKSRMVRAK